MKNTGPACRDDARVPMLADALKALSDANRLRIMCYLSRGERCVCHVEEELGISQQLASHHLGVLKDAGYLKLRRKGTMSNFSIEHGFLREVHEMFEEFLGCAEADEERAEASC
jgi:ArsR family transcriptional regulator, arsenate/arsenite/antimonite-responsive transcriptional repressor